MPPIMYSERSVTYPYRDLRARDELRAKFEKRGLDMFTASGASLGSAVRVDARVDGKPLPAPIEGVITAMLIERSTGDCYGLKLDDQIKVKFRNLDGIEVI